MTPSYNELQGSVVGRQLNNVGLEMLRKTVNSYDPEAVVSDSQMVSKVHDANAESLQSVTVDLESGFCFSVNTDENLFA